MCPDSSASRTVQKVLDTFNSDLSWYRMRKALHVFENMIMAVMSEQSSRQTRSSFKKRAIALKAIYKVGGNFAKLSFLFYTSRWWSGMLFFGLWVLYCSRPNRLWIPPIAGWTPQAIPGWIIPIQDWTNSHPMKRIKLICIYFGLLPTLV